jgi:DHA1 family multidrug resistance protein-like MFS transporter
MVPQALLAVSVTAALSLLGDSMLYAVLPTYYPEWGLPLFGVGIILSVNRFIRLISNPVAGRWFQRAGPRIPFLAGAFGAVPTTGAYALVHGLVPFVISRLAWGCCWSLIRLGGYTAVLEFSTAGTRGRLMGIFSGVSRLGSLAGTLLGGLLADLVGPRPTLGLFALATAGGGLLAWAGLRGVGPGGSWKAPAADHQPPSGIALRWAASYPVYLAGFVSGFLGPGLVTSTLGLVLRESTGGVAGIATLTGALLATRWAIDLGFSPTSGYLSDRLGRLRVALTALGAFGIALGVLGFIRFLPLVLAAAVLAYLADVALAVVLDALAGDLAPVRARAWAMSVYATFKDLGSASGPLLGYALIGWLGLAGGYILGIGLAAAAALSLAVKSPSLLAAVEHQQGAHHDG